ncbi:PREDICTED: proline-rich protein HaeIII subfamily 1-like [Pseudopodoces humilis]|uniref:proline-rich protein HaeIII subfamily 1-like n=1 Tax=Pseudopodoces humilis TaxID=181119 RepID=UPI0006B8736A|nr:PREDICTED: proline-rich protein HaeIII subfamily 1-like [Pseudopodoces humilis]
MCRGRPSVTVSSPSPPAPGRRRPLPPSSPPGPRRGCPTAREKRAAGREAGRERGRAGRRRQGQRGEGGGETGTQQEPSRHARRRTPRKVGSGVRRDGAPLAAALGRAAPPGRGPLPPQPLRTLSPPFSRHLPSPTGAAGQGLPGTGRCQRRGSNPWPPLFLPTAGEAAEPPGAPERGTRAAGGTHRPAAAPSPCPGGSR